MTANASFQSGFIFDLPDEFSILQDEVSLCRKCERMACSQRVLSPACGPLSAKIMFVGEAPGRLGADSSCIPFHGDKAGDNFEAFLSHVNISRYDCFITNSVLCNPKNGEGNNAPPAIREIRNCSDHLKRQIKIVDPKLVVTLGSAALNALGLIEAHNLQLKSDVRTVSTWFGRKVIPLYHPGQRAMIHRSYANQLADYQFVSEIMRRGESLRKNSRSDSISDQKIVRIIERIFSQQSEVTYFALHKLFYLVEYFAVRKLGFRMTNAYIVRQKDGPYCTNLHISKLKKAFPKLKIRNFRGKLVLCLASDDLFHSASKPIDCRLDKSEEDLIREVMEQYSAHSDSKLKTSVYLTRPMRELLRAERAENKNTFNWPINFQGSY